MLWPLGSKALLAVVLSVALLPVAHAKSTRDSDGKIPCAVIENASGLVQVMDPSRTQLLDADPKTPIDCDGWVSVTKGWVSIVHRDGFKIQLSAQTFAQFPENNTDGKRSGDPVILYRGSLHARTGGGSGELRVVTANARTRTVNGSAIVVFNESDEETQLLALEGESAIENRFHAAARTALGSGEASNLNFKRMRILPSIPNPMAVASLRFKLVEFKLPEKEVSLALQLAKERQERKFTAASAAQRKIASSSVKPVVKAKPKQSSKWVSEHLSRKLAGGMSGGDRILFPEKTITPAHTPQLKIEDPSFNSAKKAELDREKQRLMEELSQLRFD